MTVLLGFFTLHQHQNHLEGLLKQIAGSLPASGSVCTESRVGLENLCLLWVPRRCWYSWSGTTGAEDWGWDRGWSCHGLSLGLAIYLLNSIKCLHIHVLWCLSVKCFADSTCIVGFLGRLNEIVCVKCLKYAPFATMVMRYVSSFVNFRI